MRNIVLCLFLFSFYIGCVSHEKKGENKNKLEFLKLMADSNYKGKNYETAKLYFDTLINLSADSGVYYFKRGYSKMMTLKYAPGSIINDFHSSLINGYSNKEAVYLDMGLMFRLVDRSDSALYYLDKCLEIHPDEKKAIDLKKEIELSLQNPIQRGT